MKQYLFGCVLCLIHYYGNSRVSSNCVHVPIKFILNPCGYHHNHHLVNMELGQWLTCSGFACLEVSLMVSPGFFCLLVCSFLEFLIIYYGGFCLYVATNLFFILVFCPKLQLYLVLLHFLCMFYNLSMHILLFLSYI